MKLLLQYRAESESASKVPGQWERPKRIEPDLPSAGAPAQTERSRERTSGINRCEAQTANLFLRHFSVQPKTRPLVEMGQGECCSCDHADRNFPGTRLKCEESGRLQAFESGVERPPTEPKDEQRIDEPGRDLGFNGYPAALTCGGVRILLWSEIDNIILHRSLLSFTDRTPLGRKKLQDFSEIRL